MTNAAGASSEEVQNGTTHKKPDERAVSARLAGYGVVRCGCSGGGDDAVYAGEEEVVEVMVDEEGGQHGYVEAEVVLLHHVARPGVEQLHRGCAERRTARRRRRLARC